MVLPGNFVFVATSISVGQRLFEHGMAAGPGVIRPIRWLVRQDGDRRCAAGLRNLLHRVSNAQQSGPGA